MISISSTLFTRSLPWYFHDSHKFSSQGPYLDINKTIHKVPT